LETRRPWQFDLVRVWQPLALLLLSLLAGGCFGGGDSETATTAPTEAKTVHGIAIAGDPASSRELAESLYRAYGPGSDSAADWFAHIKLVSVSGSNGKATIHTDLTKGDPTASDDPVTSICQAATSSGASSGVVTDERGAAISKCSFVEGPEP
jgi:hypothetical protein